MSDFWKRANEAISDGNDAAVEESGKILKELLALPPETLTDPSVQARITAIESRMVPSHLVIWRNRTTAEKRKIEDSAIPDGPHPSRIDWLRLHDIRCTYIRSGKAFRIPAPATAAADPELPNPYTMPPEFTAPEVELPSTPIPWLIHVREKREKTRGIPRLDSTIPKDGPTRAILKVLGVSFGGLAAITLVALLIKNALPMVQTVKSFAVEAMASKPRRHYVKAADMRPVPVYPSSKMARIGGIMDAQSKTLIPGERYFVVKDEGDVISLEAVITPNGKPVAVWVDKHDVVDVK